MPDTMMAAPVALPMQLRRAPILPATVNTEARSVDVVFTTGAAVRRRRWTGWDTSVPFDEILDVSDRAVDLTRLNAGAPALDSHSVWSSHSQVGVVERAWIEGKEGKATIRFPREGLDQAADRMFGLISDGTILCPGSTSVHISPNLQLMVRGSRRRPWVNFSVDEVAGSQQRRWRYERIVAMPDIMKLLIGGKRIVAALGKNTSGRYGLRFSRGVSTHILGQAAVKGVRRVIPKAYEAMSKEEKWVTDQATELAVRIATNVSQGALETYIDQNDIDSQADSAATSLVDQIVRAINSRVWSVSYDFAFGKIDRDGKLLVQKDLIKQAILAGVGEYFHSHTESHKHE